MSETYISSAEESLVELAEQPHLGSAAWASTNTLVFSHLIPARRFAEARLWCNDLIELETGYESWNALSNLGIVEFESGNTGLARGFFQAIIDAGTGPVDEAEEYIERIDSGEKRPLDTRVNWEYSEKWKKVDVSKPIKGKATPHDLYLRLIKLFDVQNTWSEMEESYRQSPAAAIYGLVNGIDTGLNNAGIEIDREVIVRACSDAVQFVVGEEAINARPGPIRQDDETSETDRLDENDPEVISETALYNSWAAKYEPIAYIAFELEEIPAGIPNEYIWSEHSGSGYDYLSKGFESFRDSRDPARCYVVTKNPIEDLDKYESINTELQRYCEECEGEGTVDDEDCEGCDGAGTQYYEIPSNYPLIISTQEELDAFTSSYASTPSGASVSVARFCTSCGSARPDGAKFCVSCGEKF